MCSQEPSGSAPMGGWAGGVQTPNPSACGLFLLCRWTAPARWNVHIESGVGVGSGMSSSADRMFAAAYPSCRHAAAHLDMPAALVLARLYICIQVSHRRISSAVAERALTISCRISPLTYVHTCIIARAVQCSAGLPRQMHCLQCICAYVLVLRIVSARLRAPLESSAVPYRWIYGLVAETEASKQTVGGPARPELPTVFGISVNARVHHIALWVQIHSPPHALRGARRQVSLAALSGTYGETSYRWSVSLGCGRMHSVWR